MDLLIATSLLLLHKVNTHGLGQDKVSEHSDTIPTNLYLSDVQKGVISLTALTWSQKSCTSAEPRDSM